MNCYTMPKKPKTTKGQVSALWEIVGNHVMTALRVHNMKMNFLIAMTGINVALLGITLSLFLTH